MNEENEAALRVKKQNDSYLQGGFKLFNIRSSLGLQRNLVSNRLLTVSSTSFGRAGNDQAVT